MTDLFTDDTERGSQVQTIGQASLTSIKEAIASIRAEQQRARTEQQEFRAERKAETADLRSVLDRAIREIRDDFVRWTNTLDARVRKTELDIAVLQESQLTIRDQRARSYEETKGSLSEIKSSMKDLAVGLASAQESLTRQDVVVDQLDKLKQQVQGAVVASIVSALASAVVTGGALLYFLSRGTP